MSGKTLATGVAIWLVLKALLNLILGFSFGDLIALIISIGLAVTLIIGITHMNYVVAILMGIVVLKNLPGNLMHFQLIYLLEAVVDVAAIYILVVVDNVKVHFMEDQVVSQQEYIGEDVTCYEDGTKNK